MNKVMMMGNLTREPEVRYSQSANPVAVAKYGIAVRRQFAKQGEPDVDFFNVVAFGKAGEFAEKYFKKGQQVAIVGRLQANSWEDKQGVKHTSYDIIVEEQHFCGKKSSSEDSSTNTNQQGGTGFTPTNFDEDDDLPF